MRRCVALAVLASCAGAAVAETVYVTDSLRLGIQRGREYASRMDFFPRNSPRPQSEPRNSVKINDSWTRNGGRAIAHADTK